MNSLKAVVRYAVKRGAEPSSYAGLAAIAAALGYSMDPGLVQALAVVGAALCGAMAVALKG